jgi:hypothetical protein
LLRASSPGSNAPWRWFYVALVVGTQDDRCTGLALQGA